MRSGAARPNPAASAASGASEVSTATLQSKDCSRATTSAYQLSGIPGGSEPESTTQRADSARSRIAAVSAASAASSITAPGSLIFVVVPSVR